MDAVEFIVTHDRMCKYERERGINTKNEPCPGCCIPAKLNIRTCPSCKDFIKQHPAEAVEIVERWAKEHPRKTRQSELLEWLSKRFPRMNQDNFWWRDICPKDIDSKVKCPVCANGMTMHCPDCREIYWLSEVDDNGN